MDKPFWQEIVKNDCAVPQGYTVAQLTPELLGFLSSTDPELRDDVAYMVFARWIVRDKLYSPDDLRGLLKTLTDNLMHKIGEKDSDSVLVRSFSALALSLIVYRDNQDSFLTSEEVHDLLEKVLAYLIDELDLRGYLRGKGWLHATAHTADVLKFLARNPKTTGSDHQRILNAIQEKLSAPVRHVFVHDEDERLVLAVLDVLKRGTIAHMDWMAWLDTFKAWKDSHITSDGPFQVTIHTPYMNQKNFLRSLYFSFQAYSAQSPTATGVTPLILEAVQHFGVGTIYAS